MKKKLHTEKATVAALQDKKIVVACIKFNPEKEKISVPKDPLRTPLQKRNIRHGPPDKHKRQASLLSKAKRLLLINFRMC
mmetsp:Transcript_31553/g.52639  ORF Transcript_31553/g.52639 Transcript_31553/m.52639 type:complete len:80 (-) Transcript_31553:154-393(-)